MNGSERQRPARWPIAAPLAFAGLWSLALVAGVSSVPVIGGTLVGPGGKSTDISSTLVEEVGGVGAFSMVSLPLAATILIACLAVMRPSMRRAVTALAIVGVLGTFNLLAMLTIGIFFVPCTVALLIAVCILFTRVAPPTPLGLT